MEALKALGLKPICVIPNQTATPRKVIQFATHTPSKVSTSNNPPKLSIHGSFALLASVFSAKLATALTYEEALEHSANTNSGADFDAASVVEIIVNNPLITAAGVAVIALPLVVSLVLGGNNTSVSARTAFTALTDQPSAQLLDIRSLQELKQVGRPDPKGFKKKPVSIPYTTQNDSKFMQLLSIKFKDPENTTLYILDAKNGYSGQVAELATYNKFKAVYTIIDGAEGWRKSGLPWILPKKSFSFDFSGFAESFGGRIDGDADALPLTLGVAAAAGLGLLAFTEVETVLQLLGSAALVQLFSKKLLFAEDRKQTLRQLDEFLSTKVAPEDLVTDFKQIGTALLPTVSPRALPAPAEAASVPAVAENTVLKTEAAPESQAETAAQPTLEINAASQNEVKPQSHPRALSPYRSYPDFKAPTSPWPSRP